MNPSSHPFYKPSDSWTEELAIGQYAFKGAMNKISSKVTINREHIMIDLNLIITWMTYPNLTYHLPNYPRMLQLQENKIFHAHYPHFKSWSDKIINEGTPLNEIRFSPSKTLVFPASYIQKNTSEDQTKDYTKKESTVSPFISIQAQEAWSSWIKYQKEKFSKIYTNKEAMTIFKAVENLDEGFITIKIKEAITKGWKSFFFTNVEQEHQKFIAQKQFSNEKIESKFSPEDIFGRNG